ncbi:MAG: hypothetical protein J5I90_11225 [Caldilineales bacterium]|nr:hypothetical protein [Caldilineales bacterium]
MKTLLFQLIRQSPFRYPVRNRVMSRKRAEEFHAWEAQGRPVPPPHLYKQQIIKLYANAFGLRTLVETGTYAGDMVEAMKRHFDRIYSIELSAPLYARASKRFEGQPHIEIIHGDSGKELAKIMLRLDRPALFWLDGHHCGGLTAQRDNGTPLLDELHHILGAAIAGHVILIDDMREFGQDPNYPQLDEVRALINSYQPARLIAAEHDIMRVTPQD